MKNYFKFLVTPIVFPEKIRKDIAKYLLFTFIFSVILEIIFILLGYPLIKGSLLFFTMNLILMPFFLYFGYTLKRVAKVALGKQKKDKNIKFWILGKYFFYLMTIIITYLWLIIMLLVAAMCVISK